MLNSVTFKLKYLGAQPFRFPAQCRKKKDICILIHQKAHDIFHAVAHNGVIEQGL